jgi:hypothetical protein
MEKDEQWELHKLYPSPDIIMQIKSRRMRWAGHVARMGMGETCRGFLIGNPEGKNSLGKPRSRWEDGIKTVLREIGWGVVVLIHLAQDRGHWRDLVNAVINFRDLPPRS